MVIKRLLCKIQERRHPTQPEDLVTMEDRRHEQRTFKWRIKLSLPSRSSKSSKFVPSTSTPCFSASHARESWCVTGSRTSDTLCFDDSSPASIDQSDLVLERRRPLSCSAVEGMSMPDILHVLRSSLEEEEEEEDDDEKRSADNGSTSPCMIPSSEPSAFLSSTSSEARPPIATTDLGDSSSSSAISVSSRPADVEASPSEDLLDRDQCKTNSTPLHEASADEKLCAALEENQALRDKIQSLESTLQQQQQQQHPIRMRQDEVLRIYTRAQLALIEYLEGEDDVVASLERFKRQLEKDSLAEHNKDFIAAAGLPLITNRNHEKFVC